MKDKLFNFILIILLFVMSCTISKNYQEQINLPPGTTVETAEKIVSTIVSDGFFKKIMNKYPKLNTKEDSINIFSGYTKGSSGPKDIHILIVIKYTGKLYEPKEIAGYGKGLVEGYLIDHFANMNECHRTLLQMSDGLRFANRLFALQRLRSGTRQ